MSKLIKKQCIPCKGNICKLNQEQINVMLKEIPMWQINQDGSKIFRVFQFKNFYQTIAFVNAIAWVAHQEGHHPSLDVEYNSCKVTYLTHAVGGLSENDLICAAKIDCLCK